MATKKRTPKRDGSGKAQAKMPAEDVRHRLKQEEGKNDEKFIICVIVYNNGVQSI